MSINQAGHQQGPGSVNYFFSPKVAKLSHRPCSGYPAVSYGDKTLISSSGGACIRKEQRIGY
jgi:hypothetical protein